MSTECEPIHEPPCCVPPPLFHAHPFLPLPPDILLAAAEDARKENPANAPPVGILRALDELADIPLADSPIAGVPHPLRIALMTNMYFGPDQRTLTVSFMEQTSDALADKIIGHMNAWACGIRFAKTGGVGDVRISRGGGGYWSYLGVSIRSIPRDQATMNLEAFSLDTPESEYRRVVRHETGHTLGCPHEHMRQELVARIVRQKAYVYFRRTQGWSKSEVDQQVLTSLDERSMMSTPPDQTSIMCYQLPASITVDGKPITGGSDINPTDATFIQARYPAGTSTPTPTPVPTPTPTPVPTPTPTPTGTITGRPGDVVFIPKAGNYLIHGGQIGLTPR